MNCVKCKRLRMSRLVTLALALLMLFSLAACSGTGAAFSLNQEQVTLEEGETCQLSVKNAGGSSIRWESSSEAVATVSQDGMVTAVSGGRATIAAILSGDNGESVRYATVVVNAPQAEQAAVPGAANQMAQGAANVYTLDTATESVLIDETTQDLFFNNAYSETKAYFKAGEEAVYATDWEISGTIQVLSGNRGYLGFLFKDESGKELLLGVYRDHIIISEKADWSDFVDYELANHNAYIVFNQPACSFYWGESHYGGKTLHFKLSLQDDAIKAYFWNDDERFCEPALAWTIPLTGSQFGGFQAGTAYQLGLSSSNASTYFKVSGLVVKAGQTLDAE